MSDTIEIAARHKARGRVSRPHCEHLTCTGCSTCPCHKRPKNPKVEAATPDEALAQAVRLRLAARRAMMILDAITETNKKTKPRAWLELAVIRGHADLDDQIRSPRLNGAVSGGDDPSWRIYNSLVDRDENFIGRRGDAIRNLLAELTRSIEELERHAALASTIVDDLRAISATEAQQLIDHDSDVQHCANKNCGKLVTGTRDDRLKAGRCGPCYEYHLDHHGEDRPKQLIERELQRELSTHAPAKP